MLLGVWYAHLVSTTTPTRCCATCTGRMSLGGLNATSLYMYLYTSMVHRWNSSFIPSQWGSDLCHVADRHSFIHDSYCSQHHWLHLIFYPCYMCYSGRWPLFSWCGDVIISTISMVMYVVGVESTVIKWGFMWLVNRWRMFLDDF